MSTRRRLFGPLWRRLAAGSMAIALASIGLLALITVVLFDFDIGNASHEPESVYVSALLSGLRSSFQAEGSWQGADLSAPRTLAELEGFGLTVSAGGRTILRLEGSQPTGRSITSPIRVGSSTVGFSTISYPASGLTPAESNLRNSLVRAVLIAAGSAAALALAAAVLAGRRLVAPLRGLSLAVARFRAGDRSARVGEVRAADEVTQLAAAFDGLATDLERADHLRRDVIADVSHELRTPVAIIRAELEAIAAGIEQLSGPTVHSLIEEVERLTGLIDDLGVLAAAEATALTLRPERVDLADIAAKAATRLAPKFAEGNVHLVRKLEPVEIEGDAMRLEQMAVNLLSNAVKFSQPGSSVYLAVHLQGPDAQLLVTDEGPGIARAEQARVFDRFYRGTNSALTAGSGIGLAVVRAIVTAHGGSVELDSDADAGSTFRVRLPSTRKS